MTVTIDLTEAQILATLRAFLLDILDPAVEVVKGQVNRVPQVTSPDYIVITPGLRRPLSRPIATMAGDALEPDEAAYKQPTECSYQLDVYGPDGADTVAGITFPKFFAASTLAIQPLYPEDPKKVPYVNAEAQYEDRWVVDAILQANPVTTTVQQYADTVAVGLIEVDATYPPGDA